MGYARLFVIRLLMKRSEVALSPWRRSFYMARIQRADCYEIGHEVSCGGG